MSADYTPTDLENQGIAGPNKLRELLTTCEDPIDAIKSFQQSNSIQLPTLNPALKLLDLHGVRRFEYHEIVLNEVTERLLIRLRSLGEANDKKSQKLLEQQLEKSFALYRVPQIRPVVLEALKQLPKVPDRYLKVILADPEFYKSCSVKVRQQIWLKNDALFVAAVEPLLDAYVNKKEKMLRNVDCGGMATFFVSETTKARRQWTEI
uniref:Uncharacterized protein n=1 Tax=Plectus sambesii TaxID=2011161 RepID=A0A914XDQ1_9BILA